MAVEEVGARLSLRDRRQFSSDAERAARDVRGVGRAADDVDAAGRRMGGGLGVARTALGGVMSLAKVGGVALAGLAAGAGAAGVKFVGLAMDAAETQSAFNTVFAESAPQVQAFVDTINQDYGIPTAELQDAARQFGVFAKAAGLPASELTGFSTSLTQAALDLGSFYNAAPEEVFGAIQSGLAGETEALRRFGIFMSQASLDAFALQQGLGKTTAEMTEGEKVALRQQFILANLGDAQGDLARTSDGLANQWRGLQGRLKEAGTAIGTALLPAATGLTTHLNTQLAPAVTWLQDSLPGVVTSLTTAAQEGVDRMRGVWEGGGSYGEAVAALTGLDSVAEPVDRVADALGDVWTILRDGVIPALGNLSTSLPITPLNIADGILDVMADHATALEAPLTALIVGWGLWKAGVIAHNVVMAVSGGIMAARVFTTMLLTGATGLNTAAELTRNQAILASIALHSRMAVVLGISLVRTVASTTATLASAVAMGVVRGAVMTWTAAQWLLNTALMMNPIGLVVLAIVALVAIIVLAWRRSETFRNVVIGVWNAVKSGVSTAVQFVIGKWNEFIGFLSGLPGRIGELGSRMWEGIKSGARAALNWVIDKWNRLDFAINIKVPDWVPGVGGKGFSVPDIIPDIPRVHSGGTIASGGLANIRPDEELVVLPESASVIPLPVGMAPTPTNARREPIVIQVALDRRVVAEAVYDETQDRMART